MERRLFQWNNAQSVNNRRSFKSYPVLYHPCQAREPVDKCLKTQDSLQYRQRNVEIVQATRSNDMSRMVRERGSPWPSYGQVRKNYEYGDMCDYGRSSAPT